MEKGGKGRDNIKTLSYLSYGGGRRINTKLFFSMLIALITSDKNGIIPHVLLADLRN